MQLGCLRHCFRCVRGHGSPLLRASGRYRQRRSSRWPASSASSGPHVSLSRQMLLRRRKDGRGLRRAAQRCSSPARYTWSVTCSPRRTSWAFAQIWSMPARPRSGLKARGGGQRLERRGAFGAHDDRRRRADRRASDPGVLRGRLRVWTAVLVRLAGLGSKLVRPMHLLVSIRTRMRFFVCAHVRDVL